MNTEELYKKLDEFNLDPRNKAILITSQTDSNQIAYDINDNIESVLTMITSVMVENKDFAFAVITAVEAYAEMKGKDLEISKEIYEE